MIVAKKFMKVFNSMPFQCKGVHFCIGSGKFVLDLILPIFKFNIGRSHRLHTIVHAGSSSEILAQFRPYGLGDSHVDAVFGGPLRSMATFQPWLVRRAEERD